MERLHQDSACIVVQTLMLGGLKEEAVQYSQLESALRSMRQREQVRAVGLGCASRLAAAVLLPRVELLEESVGARLDAETMNRCMQVESWHGLCFCTQWHHLCSTSHHVRFIWQAAHSWL